MHSSLVSLLLSDDDGAVEGPSLVGSSGLTPLPPFLASSSPQGCSESLKRVRSAVTGRPLSPAAYALQDQVCTLPVVQAGHMIFQCLRNNRVSLIYGDTGSGKTSQVPQIAVELAWRERTRSGPRQVFVALPQRRATTQLFDRVCAEADIQPGPWAGCRTRATTLGEINAPIVFLTAGYLAAILSDELLRRTAVIVLDEVQSRKQEMSYLLAVLKRKLVQFPSLRLVLMGAEDDEAVARQYFGSNVGVAKVAGRRFTVFRLQMSVCPLHVTDVDAGMLRRAEVLVRQEMAESMGVILVFLKGEPEITILLKSLEDTGWRRLPFHSELETEQQDEVQELGPEACRTVVAATNMAETSLTLQPVTTIISSCRVNRKSVGPDDLPRVFPY